MIDIILEASEMLKNPKKIERKPGYDAVTEIDRKIERFLAKAIQKKHPGHNIIAEEETIVQNNSSYTWIIDPIDGTNNFVTGYPHYCISISLNRGDDPIEAYIYDPIRKHMFTAKKGKGARLNRKRISVSKTKKLSESIVEISESGKKREELNLISDLIKNSHRIRCAGSTALSLAYVAAGFIDARVKPTIGEFDVSGGALMIREAGGIVINFSGKNWHLHDNLIATNKYLQKQILEICR